MNLAAYLDTRIFSRFTGCSRGLSINHLQRLADPFSGPPRHNPGTLNLSWSHLRRSGCRIRVVNEFGFAVEEIVLEEDRVPPEVLFHEVARILGIPYDCEPP
jgi:hypothetical protein